MGPSRVICSLMITWYAAIPAVGADQRPPPPSAAEIAEASEHLGNVRFAVREEAAKLLWRAGADAIETLERAAKSDDLERCRRAEIILERIRLGLLPGSPPEVVKLLKQYRTAAPGNKEALLNRLFKLKQYETVLDLLYQDRDEKVLLSAFYELVRKIRVPIAQSLMEGDEFRTETLLKLMSRADPSGDGIRNYAYYLINQGKADDAVVHLQGLKSRRDVHQSRLLARIFQMRGKSRESREIAESAGDIQLLNELDLRLQDWKALAARADTFVHFGDCEEFAFSLVFNKWAGNEAEVRSAVAGLRALAERDPDRRWECCKVLMLAELWPEAIELMQPLEEDLFKLRADRLEFRKAFEAMGIPFVPHDAVHWFSKRAEELDQSQVAALRHSSLGNRLTRIYFQLGERDAARGLLDSVADVAARDALRDPYPYRRQTALTTEYELGWRQDAERRAIAWSADDTFATSAIIVFYRDQWVTVGEFRKFLRTRFPHDTTPMTWNRLKELWSPGQGLPTAGLSVADLTGAANRLAKAPPSLEVASQLRAFAELCIRRNEPEHAVQFFLMESKAVEEFKAAEIAAGKYLDNSPLPQEAQAYLNIGDIHFKQGRWSAAADAYEQARERSKTHPIAPYLKGRSLIASGQGDDGRKLVQAALRLPLADTQLRGTFAHELEKRGLSDEAADQWDTILRFGRYDIDALFVDDVVQSRAIQLAEQDPIQAAALWRFFLVRCLRSNSGIDYVKACPRIIAQARTASAVGLIQAGRLDEAIVEAQLAQTARPADSLFVETIVPKLDTANRRRDADALFFTAYERIDDACRDFPRSARHHNDAARMAARCDRRLDEALVHVQEAVRLEPNNVGYWETCAEVYFHRGDKEQAAIAAQRAIRLEPSNAESRQRLSRFQETSGN